MSMAKRQMEQSKHPYKEALPYETIIREPHMYNQEARATGMTIKPDYEGGLRMILKYRYNGEPMVAFKNARTIAALLKWAGGHLEQAPETGKIDKWAKSS